MSFLFWYDLVGISFTHNIFFQNRNSFYEVVCSDCCSRTIMMIPHFLLLFPGFWNFSPSAFPFSDQSNPQYLRFSWWLAIFPRILGFVQIWSTFHSHVQIILSHWIMLLVSFLVIIILHGVIICVFRIFFMFPNLQSSRISLLRVGQWNQLRSTIIPFVSCTVLYLLLRQKFNVCSILVGKLLLFWCLSILFIFSCVGFLVLNNLRSFLVVNLSWWFSSCVHSSMVVFTPRWWCFDCWVWLRLASTSRWHFCQAVRMINRSITVLVSSPRVVLVSFVRQVFVVGSRDTGSCFSSYNLLSLLTIPVVNLLHACFLELARPFIGVAMHSMIHFWLLPYWFCRWYFLNLFSGCPFLHWFWSQTVHFCHLIGFVINQF